MPITLHDNGNPGAPTLVLRRDFAPLRRAPLDDLFEQMQADLAAMLAGPDPFGQNADAATQRGADAQPRFADEALA